ncbi:hypothetical protein AB0M39_40565 [Streptomyces sp. NPDC051907]|uniref:hypothetical protein n=1 Tax=Streptomyces sp. NPDC051907 TaxID=3155284 RepID=UPI003439967A
MPQKIPRHFMSLDTGHSCELWFINVDHDLDLIRQAGRSSPRRQEASKAELRAGDPQTFPVQQELSILSHRRASVTSSALAASPTLLRHPAEHRLATAVKFRRRLAPVPSRRTPAYPNVVHLSVSTWDSESGTWTTGQALCGHQALPGPLPSETAVTCMRCREYAPRYVQLLARDQSDHDDRPRGLEVQRFR